MNPERGDKTSIISCLYQLIRERQSTRPAGSYTSYLFGRGVDEILKKLGEEATEVILAAKNNDRNNFIHECADLVYHLLVLMAEQNVDPGEIKKELKNRRKRKEQPG